MDQIARISILLVEDELLIREVVKAALEDGGYEVVTASSGAEALCVINDGAVVFRALITDVTLGRGPSGWEVARHARELLPGLAVVYMTGGDENQYASSGVRNSTLVLKPFTPPQIASAVSEALAEIK